MEKEFLKKISEKGKFPENCDDCYFSFMVCCSHKNEPKICTGQTKDCRENNCKHYQPYCYLLEKVSPNNPICQIEDFTKYIIERF